MEKSMSFEEVLQNPSLSDFHEVFRFLEANQNKILFPKKFMLSVKHLIRQDMIKLYHETPDMPILKVLIFSLTGVNENIEPEMLLELTSYIIKEWKGLAVSKQKKMEELEPA